jgi:hypothetical protein
MVEDAFWGELNSAKRTAAAATTAFLKQNIAAVLAQEV